ncbi:type 1 fimbrial protein [Pantoea sp. ARC270]|uniref:type 1 fimbrial protein n=1 Tax=Pantoea sp. ARC270 TaxID=2027923 RepID=UPI000DAACC20|nr:type 1 fimbrial protein [Pantoea sp. ARC270]PZL90098.1 type 1 fimbrial protein [Pantoea sp. ARC270]
MKSFLLTGFTTLLMTIAGTANAGSESGTITFRGAVTNGSCNMNMGQRSVVANCFDPSSGKNIVTSAELKNVQSLNALPVQTEMHWLNDAKTIGILYVSYI